MNRGNPSTRISARAGVVLRFGAVGFLLLCGQVCMAAGERFDFVAAGDTLGWANEHDCTLEAVAGKPLVVRSTGRDPFVFSPAVSLRGVQGGELIVRAAFEGPVSRLRVYFATDQSPRFGEDKTFSVPVRAGGNERDVRLPVGRHDKWRGTVIRYRLDLEPGGSEGAMHLASITYRFPTAPRLGDVRTSASVLAPGSVCPIAVVVENVTPDVQTDLAVRFEPRGEAISVEPAQVPVNRMESEQTETARSTVRAKADGVATLDVVLLRGNETVDRRALAFCVVSDGPGPAGPASASWVNHKGWHQTLAIGVDNYSGVAEWRLASLDGKGSERVGRVFPLASLLHGKDVPRLEIVRWRSHARKSGSGSQQALELLGELGSGPEKVADVRALLLAATKDPYWLQVDVELTASRTFYLRNFTSPRLLVGDGAFGDARAEAVFPGVEYLERGERSSSRLDYHTPDYFRTVPHPKKITYPLMAVTLGDRMFMLRWDYPQPEGDGLQTPAAGFASPNFVDGQKNHLMTLFWPSVPGDVPENGWEARTPVELQAGEQLKIRYWLNVLRKRLIRASDAIPVCFHEKENREPPVSKAPRDFEAERALSRIAYTKSCWREEARGWNHALPATGGRWAPHPYAFNLQFLEAERAVMPPGPECDRIDQIIEKATARLWEGRSKRSGGSDISFVGDSIVSCVEARGGHARGLMRSQREDGSWGFQPADARRAELGPKGKAEIGIVANRAIPILQYALMTGDREAEASGLKALEHMKRYVIPRAAQVWEIPVHTPDIMGSARGAEAYRLGYEITGNREYLDRVHYWLDTALPFVYFWGHPRHPYWLNATTPVFGATHYVAPNWEGLPVQWCGLVYAEEALRCPDLSGRFDHKALARGVVHSGMWQQVTEEGELQGTLPDSYPFGAKRGNPAFINPETILRPYWLMQGYDFRVNSMVVARGDDRSLRFSALAQIAGAKLTDDGRVQATLSQVRGLPFGVLICGLEAEPQTVTWGTNPVPKRDGLTRSEPGWRYLPERKWLVVNLVGTGQGAELEFRSSR